MKRRINGSAMGPLLSGSFVSVALLLAYLQTMAQGLTWAHFGVDGGDFLAAATTLGIPHPTGYPTYVLLSHLFIRFLTLGEPAYKVAVFSGVCAALGAGIFTALIVQVIRGDMPLRVGIGVITGLTFGLAPLVWSQAVIVEVHGLHLFFLSVGFFYAWRLATQGEKLGWSTYILTWVIGLGMGNHVTLILMSPVWILILLRRWRRRWDLRQAAGLAIAFSLGLAVYLYLPIRANAYPPINWGVPNTLDGFLWTISGRPYQGLAFGLPSAALPERISAWAQYLLEAYGIIGLFFGLIGMIMARSDQPVLDRAALWTLIIYSAFAVGYNTADSIDYLIPAHLAYGWFVANGLVYTTRSISGKLPQGWKRSAWIMPVLLAANTAVNFPRVFHEVDASEELQAQDYGLKVMQEAPQNAVIMTWEATDTFPLWYYQYSMGMRPDLSIVVVPLMQFDWYYDVLSRTYPDLGLPRELFSEDAVRSGGVLIALQGRPRCQIINEGVEELQLELVCSDAVEIKQE